MGTHDYKHRYHDSRSPFHPQSNANPQSPPSPPSLPPTTHILPPHKLHHLLPIKLQHIIHPRPQLTPLHISKPLARFPVPVPYLMVRGQVDEGILLVPFGQVVGILVGDGGEGERGGGVDEG